MLILRIVGFVVLVVLTAPMLANDDPPPKPAAEQKEPPQEESVEAYDSTTHGAVQVKGEDTGDWFEVLQDGKRVVPIPKPINGTEKLAPGEYEIRVNLTSRKVKIEAGKKMVLLAGTLLVEGTKGHSYSPYQGKERKRSSNPAVVGSPMAIFAGTYRVVVHRGVNGNVVVSDGAKVVAGKKTVLKE